MYEGSDIQERMQRINDCIDMSIKKELDKLTFVNNPPREVTSR